MVKVSTYIFKLVLVCVAKILWNNQIRLGWKSCRLLASTERIDGFSNVKILCRNNFKKDCCMQQQNYPTKLLLLFIAEIQKVEKGFSNIDKNYN